MVWLSHALLPLLEGRHSIDNLSNPFMGIERQRSGGVFLKGSVVDFIDKGGGAVVVAYGAKHFFPFG